MALVAVRRQTLRGCMVRATRPRPSSSAPWPIKADVDEPICARQAFHFPACQSSAFKANIRCRSTGLKPASKKSGCSWSDLGAVQKTHVERRNPVWPRRKRRQTLLCSERERKSARTRCGSAREGRAAVTWIIGSRPRSRRPLPRMRARCRTQRRSRRRRTKRGRRLDHASVRASSASSSRGKRLSRSVLLTGKDSLQWSSRSRPPPWPLHWWQALFRPRSPRPPPREGP